MRTLLIFSCRQAYVDATTDKNKNSKTNDASTRYVVDNTCLTLRILSVFIFISCLNDYMFRSGD